MEARKEEIRKANVHEVWENSADLLAELDFLGYCLDKIAGDNDWLVERLNEMSKENEAARSRQSFSRNVNYNEIMNSLSTNEQVMKEFVSARNKLVEQFSNESI